MHCTQCQYPLWNMTARVCPECGKPFLPSDYTFVTNSVQFQCPHCRQDYYGLGERGHLVPAAFDCVRCGHHIKEDEMILLPTTGVREEQTLGVRVPWLQRDQRFFRAAFKTLMMTLFTPSAIGRGLAAQTGQTDSQPGITRLKDALWFALLWAAAVGGTVGLGWSLMLTAVQFMSVSAQGGGMPAPTARTGLGMVQFGGLFALWLVAVPIVLALVWATATHGVLRIIAKPAAGITRTLECFAYASSAASASSLVMLACLWPLLIVLLPWVGVSAGCILVHRQRVSGATAAWAVSIPAIILIFGLVAWIVIAMLVSW